MEENIQNIKPLKFPVWAIFLAIATVAIISVCLYAGPLNTSPDQAIPAKYQTK